jgi:EAL and modified HD-GYP domain-containing signal transduction protein
LALIGEDKPQELVTTSLVRGQFCEELGAIASLPGRQADLFLAGLLSTLDALLDRPIAQVLEQMSISEEISHALLDGDSLLGDTLHLAIAYDRADWERVEILSARSGIVEARLPEAYRRAVDWVGSIFANR